MRLANKKLWLSVVVVFALLPVAALFVRAQDVSEGCEALPGEFDAFPAVTVFGTFTFNAGDVLVYEYITVGSPDFDDDLEVQIDGQQIFFNEDLTASTSGTFEFPETREYDIFLKAEDDGSRPFNADQGEIVDDRARFECLANTSESSGAAPSGFTDGRINRFDAAAPVVVYPYSDSTGDGFIIYNLVDQIGLTVTGEEIATVGIPEVGTEIDSNGGIVAGRLPDGRYQVTAPQFNGKTYRLIFEELSSESAYESVELE